MLIRASVLMSLLLACKHPDPPAVAPASCVTHDPSGKVAQCFDFIGANSRKFGSQTCAAMEGGPIYRDTQPCPGENRTGSCTKQSGTELESVERCYGDLPSCQRRCATAGGRFSPK